MKRLRSFAVLTVLVGLVAFAPLGLARRTRQSTRSRLRTSCSSARSG